MGFDETNAVLQTWYAGEITLPRNRIQLITPVPAEGATVFEGPVGLEGLDHREGRSALGDAGEWKYKNGDLRYQCRIDRAQVELARRRRY